MAQVGTAHATERALRVAASSQSLYDRGIANGVVFPPHRRQPSDASSSTSTAAPTPLALPHCGSLPTMDVPWSPASHRTSAARGGGHNDDDDDVLEDGEDNDEYDDDDDDANQDEDELGEYVCYGDRLCLLCDGQVLALTRKFNLSYQQMALLAAATICSGGLMGVASFFIWQKGLFRKRYAALLSDLVYKDSHQPHNTPPVTMADDELHRKLEAMVANDRSSAYASQITATNLAANGDTAPAKDVLGALELDHDHDHHHHITTGEDETTGTGSESSKTQRKKARAVTFRIFQFDPETKCIKYSSLGQPVKLGTPIIVAHAASRRAIRYKSHRGAVTISRPPRNPHFRRAVKRSVAEIDASLQLFAQQQRRLQDTEDAKLEQLERAKKPRPASLTATILSKVMGSRRGSQHRNSLSTTTTTTNTTTNERSTRSVSARDRSSLDGSRATTAGDKPPQSLQLRPTVWSDPTTSAVSLRRRASQPPMLYRPVSSSTAQPPTSSSAAVQEPPKSLYRSISESCITLVRNLNDTMQLQKEKRVLEKKRKLLLKDLPNMAFSGSDGINYIGRIQQPVVPLFRADSGGRADVEPQDDLQLYLRWGAPMQLVAAYNDSPCGFHSREYYRDAQQYLSSERTTCSAATIIPIPENGNLQAIAKESIRRVAHLERRQVQLKVGTYNVWMMPRKISTFVDVSPKKNTRAKLIAEALPPCDVWVFTECFDHRARSVLLDRLKSAGGYYFNSPTVGHKSRGPDGKYLDKFLNGGVVLASKYPILSVRIKLFREVSAGSDRFADKGVLYCKILKDGLLVHVFSTHLQAWNDELSRTARRQQLEIIAEFMASMHIDQRVDCVVFVGDLNVNMWLNGENGEYDEMLEILDASDSSRQAPTATVEAQDFKRRFKFSFDGRLNPLAGNGLSSDGSLELLDYVLYSRSHRQPSQAVSYVQPIFATSPWVWKKQPQYHLSDHFPVVSELTFDMWRE